MDTRAEVLLAAATREAALEHALRLFERANDPWGEGNVRNLLGFIREREARFDDARDLHARAVALFERAGDPLGESDSWNNLAVVHARAGALSEASMCHKRALTIRSELDRRREGNSHNNLGVLCAGSGDVEKANDHFRTALDLARRGRDVRGEGKALNNEALLELPHGPPETILTTFRRALELRLKRGDLRGAAKTHNNIALVLVRAGATRDAEAALASAAQLAADVGDRLALAHILANSQWLRASAEAARSFSVEVDASLPESVLVEDAEAFPVEQGVAQATPRRTPFGLFSSGSTTPETSLSALLTRIDPAFATG